MNDDQFAVIRQSALRDTLTALLGAVIILWLGIAVHDVGCCAVSTGSDGATTSYRGKFSLGATAHSQSSRITFRYRKSARINSLEERNLSEGQRDQHRAAGLQAFTNIYHVLLACETKAAQILKLPGHS